MDSVDAQAGSCFRLAGWTDERYLQITPETGRANVRIVTRSGRTISEQSRPIDVGSV